jgi:hypothetical protein
MNPAAVGECDVLHLMWDHISNCYARAADARRRSELTNDPERKADLLLMEQNWQELARSYELSEQLERTLLARSEYEEKRKDWQRAAVAPFDRDLELATIGADGIRSISFPCRRILTGWVDAATRQMVALNPTHWREWFQEP